MVLIEIFFFLLNSFKHKVINCREFRDGRHTKDKNLYDKFIITELLLIMSSGFLETCQSTFQHFYFLIVDRLTSSLPSDG